jgi:hypothetical protein
MSKGLRWAYLVLAVLFVIAVSAQVLMAGLAIFWRTTVWESHVGIGHMAVGLPLLMLIVALIGRLPLHIRPYTGLLLFGVILQAEFFPLIRSLSGLASAYHPLLAMLLFWGGLTLTQRAWVLVREPLPLAVAPRVGVASAPRLEPAAPRCDPVTGAGCA